MISLNCIAWAPLHFARIAAVAAIGMVTLSGLAGAHEYKSGPLTIVHPWARATVPAAKVAGGYFIVKNESAQADRLVAVTAEVSDKPEIHEMAIKGDVMQMRQIEGGLPIPAHGEVVLKPGSYHIMFMALKQQLKEGASFKGTLTFEKAGTVPVEFRIEAMGTTSAGHKGH